MDEESPEEAQARGVNLAIEERGGLLADVRDITLEISEIPPPALAAADIGLDTTLSTAEEIASELDGLSGKEYVVKVKYQLTTEGTPPIGVTAENTIGGGLTSVGAGDTVGGGR
jgi:hypothetical protein